MITCKDPRCNPCHTVDYESSDIAFLFGFLDTHDNSTFIDVGAHVGLYVHTLNLMLPIIKRCNMLSIEPDPVVLNMLYNNTAPHHVLPVALWSEPTQLHLHKDGNPHGYVKMNPGDDGIPVISTTLDLACNAVLPQTSALALKIDTEGSEGLVLEGGHEILSRSKCGAIVVELSISHLKRYSMDVEQVISNLAAVGYKPTEAAVIEQVQQGYKRNVHFVKEDGNENS